MDLLAQIADVVVAEIVVHREKHRRAQPRESGRRVESGRVPEGEGGKPEPWQPGDDDDGERCEHARPEEDGEPSNIADLSKEKQRQGHTRCRRYGRGRPGKAGGEVGQVLRKTDRTRGDGERLS